MASKEELIKQRKELHCMLGYNIEVTKGALYYLPTVVDSQDRSRVKRALFKSIHNTMFYEVNIQALDFAIADLEGDKTPIYSVEEIIKIGEENDNN